MVKYYLVISFLLFGETFSVPAQSKKDQILLLSKQVDSLNQVLNSKDLNLVEADNQSKKLQGVILTEKNKNIELQRLLDIQIQQVQEYKILLEKSLDQNQKLHQEIRRINSLHVERNCSDVIGNSIANYPIRTTGEASGCIGDGCDEIPSDSDLHKAILAINEDLSGDGVIGTNDLSLAVIKSGDSNSDGVVDIYDLVYPSEIRTAKAESNVGFFQANKNVIYSLAGRISENGDRILFDSPIDISYTTSFDGNSKIFTEKRKEIFLVVSSDIILYRKKNVVLKGKINYGITQSYKDLFLFQVDEIVGVSEGKQIKKLMLGSRELKVGDKIRFEDPELHGWKNIDMSTHYVLYRTLDGWEIQIGSSGDRYLKVEFITPP